MKDAYFQLNNFSCGYPNFKVQDITCKVNKGSFVGVIGPNGSGKSTLLKGISNIIPKHEGEIELDGINLEQLSVRERARNIAVVSQFQDLISMKLSDYVMMGRVPYQGNLQLFESKHDVEIANKYMQLTDVMDIKDQMLNQLSGGEQQRAAIARALSQEPKLLLLDEPTAHLDIGHQVRILDLISRLNKQMELTVLMVIHDLNLASEYCDHLILLKDGKIHKQGNAKDVLNFKTIEEVYNTPVITRINPYSAKPVVFLLSEAVMKMRSNGGKEIE